MAPWGNISGGLVTKHGVNKRHAKWEVAKTYILLQNIKGELNN